MNPQSASLWPLPRLQAPFGYVLFVSLFFLAGCTTLPSPPKEYAGGDADSAEITAFFASVSNDAALLESWRYAGKFALRTKQGNDRVNLDWHWQSDLSTLRLFGPLGMGAIKVVITPESAVITDSKGELFAGQEPEALLWQTTRVPLPVSALKFWLFGLPDPSAAFESTTQNFGDSGQIITLTQYGWTVELADYRVWGDETNALPWPRKIIASGQDGNGEPVTLRLISKAWSVTR